MISSHKDREVCLFYTVIYRKEVFQVSQLTKVVYKELFENVRYDFSCFACALLRSSTRGGSFRNPYRKQGEGNSVQVYSLSSGKYTPSGYPGQVMILQLWHGAPAAYNLNSIHQFGDIGKKRQAVLKNKSLEPSIYNLGK